jgi:hypothetical protein
MRNTLVVLMLGSTMAMLPVGARAHHSFQAEYDGSQPTDYVGIISRVDQQNPHGFIYVDVPPTSPGGRVTNWALETPGPNQLVRNGFTREMYEAMVEQGEEVTVRGYPARDGSKHAFAETLTRADGRTVITISVGGVDGNVGRAPQAGVVTVDGESVPEADPPARGGPGGGGRGGGGRGGRGGAPQGGAPQ